jgi:hypothetical protein
MIKKIQCQKRYCKAEANWIVTSPELQEGKSDEFNVLQKEIGFCSTDHLVEFFTKEYFDWAMKKDRKYKRSG